MASSVAPNIVTDGLVFAYDAANRKSYPATGTAITDLSGNGSNGILTNGPTFDSANGGSLVFDGVNDYIRGTSVLSNISSGLSSSQSYSIWFKPQSDITTTQGLIFWSDFEGIAIIDNEAFIQTNGDNSIGKFSETPIVNVGTWNNVVFNFNQGNSYECYLNNISYGIDNTTDTSPAPSRNLLMGARLIPTDQIANYYLGNIAMVSIYNRSLTQQEVLQNYNATKSRFI
jgi:hypothetical protein